jgi:hypothetical protein
MTLASTSKLASQTSTNTSKIKSRTTP